MVTVEVKLAQAEYGFEATDASGLQIKMDNSRDGGGKDFGVSPMQSLLMALGGCSGIDMVSILKKQRQTIEALHITVQGEREKDRVPALWETAHLSFQLRGDIQPLKAQQAAALSMDKYCSVGETLRRAGCAITWEVTVNDQPVPNP